MGEGTVRKYQADLTDEIEPQIRELLARAEKGLNNLHRRESVLQAKAEAMKQAKQSSRATVSTTGLNKSDARRIQMLARQRERLEEELEALQEEVDSLVRVILIYQRVWLTQYHTGIICTQEEIGSSGH